MKNKKKNKRSFKNIGHSRIFLSDCIKKRIESNRDDNKDKIGNIAKIDWTREKYVIGNHTKIKYKNKRNICLHAVSKLKSNGIWDPTGEKKEDE